MLFEYCGLCKTGFSKQSLDLKKLKINFSRTRCIFKNFLCFEILFSFHSDMHLILNYWIFNLLDLYVYEEFRKSSTSCRYESCGGKFWKFLMNFMESKWKAYQLIWINFNDFEFVINVFQDGRKFHINFYTFLHLSNTLPFCLGPDKSWPNA